MNTRKYNTDPETLLKQGKTIMSPSDDSKFYKFERKTHYL